MKKVEARALNLTSKLLIKEMDLGLLKKEKIRLEQQVKEKAGQPSKERGGGKKEKTINLGTLSEADRKEPTLKSSVNNSVEEKSSAEKTDVKEQIVDKLLDIKKKQQELETDKEQIIEKAEKVDKDTDKEEIVDKLVDIKKKQQELEEAKKDFFSDTDDSDSDSDDSEQVESQNKGNTDKSENAIAEPVNAVTRNDTVWLNSKRTELAKEAPTLNVDQEDIQTLIKLPEASNQTLQQVLPTSPIPGGSSLASAPSSSLPVAAPTTPPPIASSLKPANPLSNGRIVVPVNMSRGSNSTLDNQTEQGKKIHIILDVNRDDVLNEQ